MADIPTTTHAFAAITSINSGDWDDFLPQLRVAVQERIKSSDYKATILRRAEFIAGISPAIPTPPEPHPFQRTSGQQLMGQKCGACGGPSAAPWHMAAAEEASDGPAI